MLIKAGEKKSVYTKTRDIEYSLTCCSKDGFFFVESKELMCMEIVE